jgi:hypothetical protein
VIVVLSAFEYDRVAVAERGFDRYHFTELDQVLAITASVSPGLTP